jgi:nicotinamide-nucleotide amidase
MTDNKNVMLIRLFGPTLLDVSLFVRGLARMSDDVPVCWDEHPEVVVKCIGSRMLSDICEKYQDQVYSIDGRSMENVVAALLVTGGHTISTAESCTGGLVGQMLTSVPGSSDYYVGGFITYSDAMKRAILDVPADLLQQYGAVSAEVAMAMAKGARRLAGTDVAVSVSGIAGPSGGTDQKPVGTVWFGLDSGEGTTSHLASFCGNRSEIRRAASIFALDLIRRWCINRRGRNPDGSTGN